MDLDAGGEDALLVRPGTDVEVRSLPPGGREFVASLAGGGSLDDATRSALEASRAFDLAANLAALIGAGAVTGYSLAPNARSALTVAAAR